MKICENDEYCYMGFDSLVNDRQDSFIGINFQYKIIILWHLIDKLLIKY